MKKATIILLSMFLMAFSIQPSTGFAYLPMEEGFWIEYTKFDISGQWHADTRKLDVLDRRVPSTECGRLPGKTCDKIRVSFSRYCTDFGSYAYDRCGWFQFWHYQDQPDTPINYARGLVYGYDVAGGKTCMSEIRNEINIIMSPPECILTLTPIAGETIHGDTLTYSHPPVAFSASGGWDYSTIACYPTWGEGVDVCRTSLNEYTGFKYNYAFMRGVGAVDIWFIGGNCVAGVCDGTEYYATNWTGK